jgi:antagonist of KipI
MTAVGVRPVARVLEPGLLTTVQDFGRFGYRRFGVPASGALDLWSLSFANGQLGNNPDSPALEVFHGPMAIAALEDIVVCHSGKSSKVTVDGTASKENPLRIRKGSTFRLEPGKGSAIVYLAIAGGLAVKTVMGSASTYTRAGFGGLHGRALQKGDILHSPVGVTQPIRRVAPPEAPGRHRVVRGPHADLFPPESLETFFTAEFRVSFDSDRMGYRLEGPGMRGFRDWGRVLTLPVFPGMVQVTPDGLPVVLMADCQTTGGYPVIGVVLPPDLCTLAQKPPGAAVSFDEVTAEESENVIEAFFRSIGFWPKGRRRGVR